MTIYFNKNQEDIEISKQKLQLLATHYKQMANILVSNEVQDLLKNCRARDITKDLKRL